MEAAKIVAANMPIVTGQSEKAVEAMEAVHAFLLGSVTEADLDKPCDGKGKPRADHIRERQNLIDSPLVVIRSLREPQIHELEEATRARTIGQLVLADKPNGSKSDTASAVLNWLQVRGLDMGMTGDELRSWILTGRHDGDEDAH